MKRIIVLPKQVPADSKEHNPSEETIELLGALATSEGIIHLETI